MSVNGVTTKGGPGGGAGEPEKQIKLRENLEKVLGTRIAILRPHAWREFGLTIGEKREGARELFSTLKTDSRFLFNMLIDITAVDWLDRREPRFDVVYQLLSLTFLHRLCVKIEVPEEQCEVESVRPLWPAANFLEREVWDMYGISFSGHGDLRRVLMYDEFVGHPLRKDYPLRGKQPRVPLRVPELRNTSADMQREELVSLPVRQGRSGAIHHG
jgi:NADH-quinone oxidoreductase subunit C